uniref:ABC transporter domain-containing protein n=1 Tax=Strigamia maritima TaxID=126957 RepID=T1IX96_STRMM
MDGYINLAVAVRQLYLSYGLGNSKVEILRGLNLCVETGFMYAILGPSGCGKTTLLRCIVGSLNAQKGLISVFGQRPGQRKSVIPGSGVGYMPQELALYEDLSIEENLNFYGCLHNIKNSELKSRIQYLIEFLNLPTGKRLAGQLSGGEKRRVSFAITILHQPPLIILDEPTVGMDPLLRESIWNHLQEMCVKGKVTMIITTHHVEEAIKANKASKGLA